MKQSRKDQKHLMRFLMEASSLHELLEILKSISERLRLNKQNTHQVLYQRLQFIFFSLMVKSDGLLNRMLLRCDTLSAGTAPFQKTAAELLVVKKAIKAAYHSTQQGNLLSARKEIIFAADTYEPVYASLQTTAFKALARK